MLAKPSDGFQARAGLRLGREADPRRGRGCRIGPAVGHEQRGVRPCIVVSDPDIISDQRFPLICVVPVTGTPDARIDSNQFGPNPNVTVFEWLNAQPAYHGQVSVFATWEVFNDIFNVSRSHLPVHCGWKPPYPTDAKDPKQQLLNELYRTTTKLEDNDTYNSFLQIPLLDYLKKEHPRVLFVGYGETDNWAHSGRYDLVLESAHSFDHFVEELWNLLQSLPEYKDQTTFILTADHGRGSGPEQWKEHGVDEKGSDNIWIAVIGPDTQPLGERTNVPPVTQSQIAATLAALLGQNYNAAAPQAGKPIADVLPQ